MARLKDDGEFQVEGTVTMWLPLVPEEGERLVVNSSQEIWPQQVWVSVSMENENWAVGSVIVKGRLYRKDNTVGERWGERMYSGPLDDGEFEGPEWLVAVLEKEIPRRLSGRTKASESGMQAPLSSVEISRRVRRSPQRDRFDSALRVLLMRENLDGTEWAIQRIRIIADTQYDANGPERKELLAVAEQLTSMLDKRTAELATGEN